MNEIESKQSAVQKYLRSLEWDGKPRIATALGEGRSVEHAANLAKGSELFFSTAVRRALEPGCVVDQSLVLVAPEGAGKSRWLHALAPWNYRASLQLCDRDSALAGIFDGNAWIVDTQPPLFDEWLKEFLTRREDVLRPPYAKEVTKVPRAFIFVFTTNELPSALLGSRRFFVVETDQIPDPTPVRDQLWAEAVATTRFFEGAVEQYRRGGGVS